VRIGLDHLRHSPLRPSSRSDSPRP
jgi:hypothetical protein